MWSNVRVAAVVVVALLAVAEASYPRPAPSYHAPAPCYPETKYVTQYQTQVKEVSMGRCDGVLVSVSYQPTLEIR